MSDSTAVTGNTDCTLIEKLWDFLWNPSSGDYYLPNIIKNGLNAPLFGIKIPPFATISVGDIPTITMFKWALEYMGVTMTSNQLSGLDTIQKGQLTCTSVSETQTNLTISAPFGQVVFSGKYDVGASGVTGCAMATAAGIMGGDVHTAAMLSGDSSDNPDLDLASWYRDQPLQESDNGQTLVGAYYGHQDTVQALTTADTDNSAAFRAALATDQSRQTTGAVRTACQDYKDNSPNPAQIGDGTQYAGGFQTSAYLFMAAQAAANGSTDPTNEYVSLLNSMTHFQASVLWVQNNYPGLQTTSQVLEYVKQAPSDTDQLLSEAGCADGVKVVNPFTNETIIFKPQPLDKEFFRRALAARADVQASTPGTFHVDGSFQDTAQQLQASISVSFTRANNALTASVTQIGLQIPNLNIQLGNKDGFNSQPGLYDKVATWLANTDFVQNLLKSKVKDALNDPSVLQSVTNALNAALKKMGV